MSASTTNPGTDGPIRFSWQRRDIECKFGLQGGRFTRVNNVLWMTVALLLTVIFYAGMSAIPDTYVSQIFMERGPTQYFTVYFTFWAGLIILAKWFKIRTQRDALGFTDLVPISSDFVLSSATVGLVLSRLRNACDDTSRYILFNRIEIGLSNLKNMGQITDVDGVFQSQAANDDDMMEASYSLLRGLVWAIPVLGFIGTVIGLGAAIGDFGGVLADSTDLAQLKPALQRVTGGLATAFDTTLVALVAALLIQLLLTFVRKNEEELLDDCKEYCHRNIISRLKITRID